jgi:predicted AlkP superfamily phosphohydrolase/phosphomutase/tetratricopeptide (TPR) repeat protein
MPYPLHTLSQGFRNLNHWHRSNGRPAVIPEHAKQISNNPEVLLIGWDAADWSYIEPLLAKGLMPNLQSLIIEGSKGPLSSMRPMLSPMLWTTIATGKRPFEHGIHGFVSTNEKGENIPVSSEMRTAPTFWEIAHHEKRKAQVVGWWPSFPPEEINGAIISDRLTLSGQSDENAVHPKSIFPTIELLTIKEEHIGPDLIAPLFENCPEPPKELVAVVRRAIARTLSTQMYSTWLLANSSTDIHAVYFNSLDHFHHLGLREYPEFAGIITNAYRFYDALLEGLLAYRGEKTNTLLLSDHGFLQSKDLLPNLPDDPLAPERDHHPLGILLCHGPKINPRVSISGASVLDITPNILHLLNIPADEGMEGRVWSELFQAAPLKRISTWKKALLPKKNIGKKDEEWLKHLQELGYVSKVLEKKSEVLVENTFQLARSYAEANRHFEALRMIEAHIKFKAPLRYVIFALDQALHCGEIEKLQKWWDEFHEKLPKHLEALFFVRLAILAYDFQSAKNALQEIPPPPHINAAWHIQLARLWMQCRENRQAKTEVLKALALQPKHPDALVLNGYLAFTEENWNEALVSFLDAISIRFFAPRVHALIGHTLLKLNQPEGARNAFQLAAFQEPKNVSHRQTKQSEEKKTVIVSGLPRSGTSMMMQILQKMGFNVFTDKQRQADSFNRDGYFEHEELLMLAHRPESAFEFYGKAVKILSPTLPSLPPFFPVYVVMMERSIDAVIASQMNMRGKDQWPLDLGEKMQDIQNQALGFCESANTWITLIRVPYEKLVENPELELKKLANDLEVHYDPKLVEVVKPKYKNY